jgi:hypothetical protein
MIDLREAEGGNQCSTCSLKVFPCDWFLFDLNWNLIEFQRYWHLLKSGKRLISEPLAAPHAKYA